MSLLFEIPPTKSFKNQWLVSLLLFNLLLTNCQFREDSNSVLQGFWTPQKYILESGESKNVSGHISFGEKHWSVVFFILDDTGNPISASAEGGEYTLSNNNLTFYHGYNFSDVSKGNTSELTKSISSTEEWQKEFCSIEIDDDLLAIYFPSGNAMIFSRSTSQL